MEGFAVARTASYAQWSLEPYCIGMKLRALRTRKRLTLSRLAEETGLSTALLSKLETDRMIPTLPTLATICRVYGVGLSHFFCEPEHHTMSITRKGHLEGSARSGEPARIVALNAPVARPRLAAQMIELSDTPISLDELNTCAVVYVLEGRLQVSAGAMAEMLEAGDCAYVESSMNMAWCAPGKHHCRLLVIQPGAPRGVA